MEVNACGLIEWVCAALRKAGRAVDAGDRPAGTHQIERIRRLIALNLTLGLIVIAVATSGQYWT